MSRLETRNVRLGYARNAAVIEDLSLRIPDGGITGIIGPNGCGKSTLLRALSRLLRPRSGAVVLDGEEIHHHSTREAARRLGLLQQHAELPEAITVEDLVSRGRYPHRSFGRPSSPRDGAAVEEAMEMAGITSLRSRFVDELSGGQRQRAWIAMLLAQETPILLLDEPTTYLDPRHRRDTLDLLRTLNARHGRSIVAVLHDVNDAAELCDYLAALREGAILAEGPASDVLGPELIERVFGIECDLLPRPGGTYLLPRSSSPPSITEEPPRRTAYVGPALRLEGVSAGYGAVPVLRDVNLDIPAGRITAILGPNACGKSTLLKALARILPPSSGRITRGGENIRTRSRRAYARTLAFLEQSGDVPPALTVEELIAVGRYPYQRWYRRWSGSDREIIEGSLEAAGMAEFRRRPVVSLSEGQRRRAFIAMALAQDTEIVLLDEPTSFLDLAHQSEVLDRMRRLNRAEGRTVAAVLHDPWQAARYADYVVVMDGGRIHSEGSPERVLTPRVIEDVFQVAADVVTDPFSGRPLVLPGGAYHRDAEGRKRSPEKTENNFKERCV